MLNDHEQQLSGFDHYENAFVSSAYPSRQMEIRYGESALRLEFGGAVSSDTQEPSSGVPESDVS